MFAESTSVLSLSYRRDRNMAFDIKSFGRVNESDGVVLYTKLLVSGEVLLLKMGLTSSAIEPALLMMRGTECCKVTELERKLIGSFPVSLDSDLMGQIVR